MLSLLLRFFCVCFYVSFVCLFRDACCCYLYCCCLIHMRLHLFVAVVLPVLLFVVHCVVFVVRCFVLAFGCVACRFVLLCFSCLCGVLVGFV